MARIRYDGMLLYQLIKPERKNYSINDRLLLSGVAHLCFRDTLREMHVRFPSPPRFKKKPPTPKPKPPKKKYGHVYLIPFTYEWPQRKTRLYKNPVIQKPECPYFSYICDLEKERLMCVDEMEQFNRADEDIKIPCELFEDHLCAEKYYNEVFKREDKCKYAILRPHIYESITPKTYPGILPKYMIKKRYPPLIKLSFDVKIYNEINAKNGKKRKVIRTICEAKTLPSGRPGQKMGETLIAKYIYIKNISTYSKKNADRNVSEADSDEGGDYPCSVCGGPQGKQHIQESKPIKAKSWIKRPRQKKKKQHVIEHDLTDLMDKEKSKTEIFEMTEEVRKLKEENTKYIEAWENFFTNIEKMEKLKLDTEKCVCPDRTRDITRFEPENDCTCAIWNLPTPPKILPKKISCECNPKLEEEYISIPPKEDKCDCKQKAREKAMEACDDCGGVPKEKTEDEKAAEATCGCTKILDACGNCALQTPMKFPLMPGEKQKECECRPEPPKEGQNVTVAYVFIDNMPLEARNSMNKNDCGCRHEKEKPYKKADCSCEEKQEKQPKKVSNGKKAKNKDEKEGKSGNKEINEAAKIKEEITEKKGEDMSKIGEEKKEGKGEKEPRVSNKQSKKKIKCSKTCGKLLELDYCQKETEKLLKSLKCNCPKCKEIRERYRAKYIQAGTRDTCGGILPIIGGTYGMDKECDCLEKFEQRVRGVGEYKKRMEAKIRLKSNKDRYIITGVKQTFQGPLYNLGGIVPNIPCTCKISQEIEKDKERQQQLSTKIKRGYKYAISGVKEGRTENDYIIGSVTKECECSKVYEKFMEEHNECLVSYEKYLQHMRNEIDAHLEDMNERYKDPPLSGEELIEREIKNMMGVPGLSLPEGKAEFIVSGVKVNDLGKSFVLGGVLLNRKESEECTIAIESYTHLSDNGGSMPKCQRTYLCNYMTFGKNCGNPFQPMKETEFKDSSEELICQCISYESIEGELSSGKEEEAVDGCACECPCGIPIEQPKGCSCAVEPDECEESCICEEFAEEEEREIETPEGCLCADVEIESSGTATDPCLCGVKNCGCQADETCVKECFYGPMEAWWSDKDFKQKQQEDVRVVEREKIFEEEEVLERSISPMGGPSKRYVILSEVPKKKADQIHVLRKLLKGLADDGFPLAKLPHCHKIPYFWLWIQFRLKKRWNYDDRVKNYRHCRNLWNHIELCRRKVPPPKLPGVHCICGASNFTWRNAKNVSKLVHETKQTFYNNIRKNMVDFAREYYATISAYQFPNPPYLNHYFYAYQPSKLEDVITEHLWEGHEHKDPRNHKSCLCK